MTIYITDKEGTTSMLEAKSILIENVLRASESSTNNKKTNGNRIPVNVSLINDSVENISLELNFKGIKK